MKAVICRTGSGSVPVQTGFMSGLPRFPASLSVQDFSSVTHSGESNSASSPRISLHFEVGRRGILRSSSESDILRSEMKGLRKLGSRSFPARIPEEESDDAVVLKGIRSSTLAQEGLWGYAGDLPESGVSSEELGCSGGGINKNRKSGGGSSGGKGDSGDRSKIGAYYQEMLKTNPTDSLLLRNYGKYLDEVERDAVKAEEYYGRAILASPGDGEVLSLYGKLIWETQRDQNRAKSYFDQALYASPDDSTVLGSYAHFMWEAEEEEEEEEEKMQSGSEVLSAAMAEAY
ncbi:Tetratricopeptide repeat (TPR)-like superfamily protein [Abeliophyllum distichum]|uniref:Tetratricopeptide repeat (TPR)-like superfamily protein n=1 Tax=Abeliophyllum distichum TaxID=126358 RepID=A0ABD1U0G7_9LAMI